jgi:hypothetical protein
MIERWTRPALFAAALLMLVAGFAAVLAGRTGTPAHAQAQHEGNVIEILPGTQGFNPQVCTLNRNGSEVRFYNADTKPRRIIVPGFMNQPPKPDTGYIQPGAYSQSWLVTTITTYNYRDADNPDLRGLIEAPISNDTATRCKPLPPTPTPTNTPTWTPTAIVTVTPTATPTVPPPQMPAGCAQFFAKPQGCAVLPAIARDAED